MRPVVRPLRRRRVAVLLSLASFAVVLMWVAMSSTTASQQRLQLGADSAAPTKKALPLSKRPRSQSRKVSIAEVDAAAADTVAVELPYKYPMHAKLPTPRWKMVEGIYGDHLAEQSAKCWAPGAAGRAIFEPLPAALESAIEHNVEVSKKLEAEYGFTNRNDETFYSADSSKTSLLDESLGAPWWSPTEMDQWNLPCTSQVQKRISELQNPKKSCDRIKYLVTKLKEGAHGVGSALTLVAHDLLSSMIVGRVLQVYTSGKWFFSSQHCADAGRGGWECFFASVASCKAHGPTETVHNKRQALRTGAQTIVKKTFDIDGLSRNDIPSDEIFFGPIRHDVCYLEYTKWLRNPANVYIQGTFERGADPALFYMLAQAMRYLMRNPQPWLRNMLRHHLPLVGIRADRVLPLRPSADGGALASASSHDDMAIIYVQERGEIAKFREYYNVFGCHNIDSKVFSAAVSRWCSSAGIEKGNTGESTPLVNCTVYISGNTPHKSYQALAQELAANHGAAVLSTWRHPSVAAAAETERWGANSPASSWMDLFAGVASTNWVCIVQSNWCRVINLLRLTAGRASCGFVDGGALMISSRADRDKYCVIGPYPTKAFSNRLR